MSRDSLFVARHALRRLARQPGFSVPVALTLALGIGATAAVFALVNGVLIRPLPYAEASRLVEVGHTASHVDLPMTGVSLGTADYYRAHNRVFEDIGVYVEHVGTLTDLDQPERVRWAFATPSVFTVLRPAVTLGRLIRPGDYEPGVVGVVHGALISHDLWVRRYGADPGLVGRTVELDRQPYPVVGGLEPGFHFPHAETDAWLAFGWAPRYATKAGLGSLWAKASLSRVSGRPPEGQPGVGLGVREVEPGLQAPHDRVGLAVQLDRSADQAGIGSVAPDPEVVADECPVHDSNDPRLIVPRPDQASEGDCGAQHREHARGRKGPTHPLGLVEIGQRPDVLHVDADILENAVVCAVVISRAQGHAGHR